MIGIKTWLYNLSKTKIYIPKTLTSEVYDSVGGTSLDQIIEKNNNNISDAYSDQKTYAVGDYCIYNNSLYKCITEITTAESFDSAKWKLTSIDKLLGNNDISSIGDGTVTGGLTTLNDNLTNHKHTKSQITDFPTSLPANGGNSDTVDNFHITTQTASNLSFSYPVIKNSSNTYKLARTDYVIQGMLSSYPPGLYWINGYSSDISDIPTKLANSHFMLLVGGNNSSKGFTIQIAIGNGAIYMRTNAGSISSWEEITIN